MSGPAGILGAMPSAYKKAIEEKLRKAGATSPDNPKTPEELGLKKDEKAWLPQIIKDGNIKQVGDRYYLAKK